MFAKLLLLSCVLVVDVKSPEPGVLVERNVAVKMRDGVVLRANVFRPDRGGPYPVLVMRTPYGKGSNFDRYVQAGYIVVSQDVRGRYGFLCQVDRRHSRWFGARRFTGDGAGSLLPRTGPARVDRTRCSREIYGSHESNVECLSTGPPDTTRHHQFGLSQL